MKNYQRDLTFLTQKSEAETSKRVDNFFLYALWIGTNKFFSKQFTTIHNTVKRGNSDHFSTLSLSSAMTDWFVNLQYAPISKW